jgi:hypothetical protein
MSHPWHRFPRKMAMGHAVTSCSTMDLQRKSNLLINLGFEGTLWDIFGHWSFGLPTLVSTPVVTSLL